MSKTSRPTKERSIESVRKRIMEAKHYFHMLGVHRGSDEKEINLARRDLALYVHPDVCCLKDATDLMARVNTAHSTLTTRMGRYVLELNGKPCAACKGRGFTSKQRGFTKNVETACAVCLGAGVVI